MKKIFIVAGLCLALSVTMAAQRTMPLAMQKLLNAE